MKPREIHVARSTPSHAIHNRAVVVKPVTFAIVELGDPPDARAFRQSWRGWGFKDVTPLWGKQGVKSFALVRSNIARWPEFKEALRSVEADWYFLSGHHGRQFASDWQNPVHESEEQQDLVKYRLANRQREAGFFNKAYNDGQFLHASRNAPDEGKRPNSVYMTTTSEAGTIAKEYENPLFDRVHPQCKGVLLSGCNTLFMRQVRIAFRRHFPNAVILGTWDKTKERGLAFSNPILKVCGNGFFTNPPSTEEKIVEFVQKINRFHFAKQWGIGIQYRDSVWYNRLHGAVFRIPVDKLWMPEAPAPGPYNAY